MSVRALAREFGISATAASLALKDSPRVSKALRERIQRRAREIGYVPNARLAELMGEVRNAASPKYHATLGAFSLYPEREPWNRPDRDYLRVVLKSATACAELHGYRLEHHWYREPGMNPARFRTILETRGMQGLFCLGSANPEETLPKELDGFAIVTFAASIPAKLHRVMSHFALDARTLFNELHRRGYRRPGLAMLVHGDRRTDYAYSSAYLSAWERRLSGPNLPILRADTWNPAEFDQWFQTHQPDVIVLHQFAEYVSNVDRYLKRQHLAVPRKVGLALLDKNPDPKRFSGICQNMERMGIAAIEMLIGRILLRDFRPPEHPKIELVGGEWNEGRTLRRRPQAPSGL